MLGLKTNKPVAEHAAEGEIERVYDESAPRDILATGVLEVNAPVANYSAPDPSPTAAGSFDAGRTPPDPDQVPGPSRASRP